LDDDGYEYEYDDTKWEGDDILRPILRRRRARSGRRLSTGDVCADSAALVRDAPGGALSPPLTSGGRDILVRLVRDGTYVVCHAYRNLYASRHSNCTGHSRGVPLLSPAEFGSRLPG
jgi:hypothetical protein